jgi:hypothetical protein
MDHRLRLHHRLRRGLRLLTRAVLATTATPMILMALRIVAAALLLAMSTATTTTALCAEIPVIPEVPTAASVATA